MHIKLEYSIDNKIALQTFTSSQLRLFILNTLFFIRHLLFLVFIFTATYACAEISVTDDTGHSLYLSKPAQRIISLAPHITESLFAAGAGNTIIGTVSYSDYPEEAKSIPRVGSYNNIDPETIAALKPDLIIAWESGNRPVNIERLKTLGIPVYINDPHTINDIARSIENYGLLAGTEASAKQAATQFRARYQALKERYSNKKNVRTFYQIWNQPLMTINGTHLISDVIKLCSGENVFAQLPQLAPTISIEAVLATDPEVIIASGMDEARPEWLNEWKKWPNLKASMYQNLFFIPPDVIQRHTPRILDGAENMCIQLDHARKKME